MVLELDGGLPFSALGNERIASLPQSCRLSIAALFRD